MPEYLLWDTFQLYYPVLVVFCAGADTKPAESSYKDGELLGDCRDQLCWV